MRYRIETEKAEQAHPEVWGTGYLRDVDAETPELAEEKMLAYCQYDDPARLHRVKEIREIKEKNGTNRN